MKDTKIKEFLERLNNKEGKETIFTRQISLLVDYAKVWDEEPKLNNDRSGLSSNNFFFIRNSNNKYVGAVLDMGIDLHWYVLKDERKNGHLTKALKSAILPYIFSDDYLGRKTQKISISYGIGDLNYKSSKKVAKSIRFQPLNENETEFELKVDNFNWEDEKLLEQNGKISSERFIELRNRIMLSFKNIKKISDELLMNYDDDQGLIDIANEVSYYNTRILDIEDDFRNNKT